ncbi:hypothetical protein [Actinosynnema mirum]|uniref:NERD domain-containing protein n=1 Tax=Actinosynnema mirum (strain ATCC 29888 / DSM 43827 / JCM 3225 / NBRC 14064 / NCIMB 13271 / NRRL B-12336 / IMRU 3971 / 101) TaxID=446462 RepID=C6W9A6_ACTMD|nr:hypothetical protein [Actinosynnema mirum]ACU35269.1 hypothetical protein Amir_1317 [Actinosynnema mirum DSM 43827]
MRLIRLGNQPSRVGADVRAALSAWGPGVSVLGGFALLGAQPPDCPRPLDAVVVLPRGVLVVVGVDLPEPALKLEAPLSGQWKTDGWPLRHPAGATSPVQEALEAAQAVARRIQDMRGEPLPVTTVVAVGPYVGQVVQPSADLHKGVRVLHPKPTTLLAAARELATSDRPCSAEHAAKLIAVLAPVGTPPQRSTMLTEGFTDASEDLASASTMLLPKVRPQAEPTRPGWLPLAAAGVGLLALVGVITAVTSSGDDPQAAAPSTAASAQAGPTAVVVDGRSFAPRGRDGGAECAGHAFGDVQAWLEANGCRELARAQYSTEVDGRAAAVALAEVTASTSEGAAALREVAARVGSGGVVPLVKERGAWEGGPASFDNSAISSVARRDRVLVAQAVWADGASAADDPALVALAQQALGLPAR